MAVLLDGALNDALVEKLMEMTPPIDEEEDRQLVLELDAKARIELEADGCVPCYPPDMDITAEPTAECREIVNYWKSLSGTVGVVLGAQHRDWRIFRRSQAQNRREFRQQFPKLTELIHELLRSHNIDPLPSLMPNPADQSRRDNWLEFHAFHLYRLREMVKERDAYLEKLGHSAPRQVAAARLDVDFANPRPGVLQDPEIATEYQLGIAERNIGRQQTLLRWIAARSAEMKPDVGQGPDDVAPPLPRPLSPTVRQRKRRLPARDDDGAEPEHPPRKQRATAPAPAAPAAAKAEPRKKGAATRAIKSRAKKTKPEADATTASTAKAEPRKNAATPAINSRAKKTKPEVTLPTVTTRSGRKSRPPERYTP